MKIFGRNAVIEALNSGVTIEKLIVEIGQRDRSAAAIIDAAKKKHIKLTYLDKRILDKECGNSKHQGFIAEVSDFNYCEVEDILLYAKEKNQPPLIILLDGIEDPHNLGSIIRVAECGGVHGVIIPRHRAASVNETVIKVSSGAAAHMRVAKVTNINDTLRDFKDLGIKCVAAEAGGQSIYDTDLTGALAIVIGGEDTGVKRLTKELCDCIVSLPMFGQVNSLNASVACGAVLYEAIRQRTQTD